MNEPTNFGRADAARRALEAVPEKYGAVDEDAVVDLITDLLHLANQSGFADNGTLMSRAVMNFFAEINE